MEVPLILRLLSASIKISYKAGAIVRQVLSSGNLGIIDKGINDLQTQADRQAQAFIVGSLMTRFPGICVIGEETIDKSEYKINSNEFDMSDDQFVLEQSCPTNLHNVNLKDVVVWVDPLDGTSEYTQGLVGHVTVLIGLAVKGRSVGGVIHQPFSSTETTEGRSIYALEGMGCFGFKTCSDITKDAPSETSNVLTTTRGHCTDFVNQALESCGPTEIIRVGGCGHKVILLLEGRCHAYIFASAGCKKWDTCAPEAVLREAGGMLTDMLGETLTYSHDVNKANNFGVLATAKREWHQDYLNKIPQSVKDHFVA